jgi:hypothetical protein
MKRLFSWGYLPGQRIGSRKPENRFTRHGHPLLPGNAFNKGRVGSEPFLVLLQLAIPGFHQGIPLFQSVLSFLESLVIVGFGKKYAYHSHHAGRDDNQPGKTVDQNPKVHDRLINTVIGRRASARR